LTGPWRSTRISGVAEDTPKAWEITFLADGTFSERIDEGFGVAARYSGVYTVNGGVLGLKETWRQEPTRFQMDLEADRLVLTSMDMGGWRAKFERSAEPLEKLDEIPSVPRSLPEAVAACKWILGSKIIDKIRNMEMEELISLHHGVGTHIRNAFDLWRGNPDLMAACGDPHMHPDDASGVILEALWRDLHPATQP
jgi:hypothetical protein